MNAGSKRARLRIVQYVPIQVAGNTAWHPSRAILNQFYSILHSRPASVCFIKCELCTTCATPSVTYVLYQFCPSDDNLHEPMLLRTTRAELGQVCASVASRPGLILLHPPHCVLDHCRSPVAMCSEPSPSHQQSAARARLDMLQFCQPDRHLRRHRRSRLRCILLVHRIHAALCRARANPPNCTWLKVRANRAHGAPRGRAIKTRAE